MSSGPVIKRYEKSKVHYVKVTFEHFMPLYRSFKISKEATVSQVARALGVSDIVTGDKDFDSAILVRASRRAEALAVLNDKTRGKILQLANTCESFTIDEESLEAVRTVKSFKGRRAEAIFIRFLKYLGRDLQRVGDVKTMIIENIISDENPDVSLQNLKVLLDDFDLEEKDISRVAKALNHKSFKVQAEVARHLGRKGMKAMAGILKKHEKLSEETKTEIVTFLLEHKYDKCLRVMKNVFTGARSVELKVEVLKYFTEYGDESLSDMLVENLFTDSTDVLIHVIYALGACGTVKSIEKIINTGGSSMNPLVRYAVNESIKSIQSRLGNVGDGWLSVAELSGTDGALSIGSEAGDGGLSIDEKEN